MTVHETEKGHCGTCRRFLEFCSGHGVCVPATMQKVAHMTAERAVFAVFADDVRKDGREDGCADFLARREMDAE